MGNYIPKESPSTEYYDRPLHCDFPCTNNNDLQQEVVIDPSDDQVDETGFPTEGFNAFLINCHKEALQCKVKLGKHRSRLLLIADGKARPIEISNVDSILDGNALDRIQGIPVQGETCAAIHLKRNSAVVLLFDSKDSKEVFKECMCKLCSSQQIATQAEQQD